MHRGCVKKRKKFGFVLRLMPPVLRLIQPVYYAPTLNKTTEIWVKQCTKVFLFAKTLIKSFVRYLKRMSRSLYNHTRHAVYDEITEYCFI